VPQPRFEIVPADDGIQQAAEAVGFPCVVKAVSLSASQGILRADDPAAAVTAARRIRQILAAARRPRGEPLIVEEYLPGPELSIDGLLGGGVLTVTAIFDKPGMPDGPTFEETLLVTPSRLPPPVLAAAIGTAGQAARALGLTHGPVHAELRIDDRGGSEGGRARGDGGREPPVRGRSGQAVMLELAARCIGGLCSRALRFPGGKTLEELVLASALGRSVGAGWSGRHCQHIPAAGHEPVRPSGVCMLPVPQRGVLGAVEGRDAALAVPGITGLTITIPIGRHVDPLPDGDRYLGFIFAEGDTPDQAEQALATARDKLRVVIL
jgi:biotin carboxylase